MKWTILVCALLVSCSGVAPDINVPKKQPPAKPAVQKIVTPLDNADANARKIRRELDAALAKLAQSRRSAEEFNAELDSLKSKGLSTQEELDLVWKELNKTRNRNMFLEEGLVRAVKDADTLEQDLKNAQKATADAIVQVSLKDQEGEELRNELETAKNSNTTLKTDLRKAQLDAENAKVYKTWVIGGICALAGFWLLREVVPIAVRFLKPL